MPIFTESKISSFNFGLSATFIDKDGRRWTGKDGQMGVGSAIMTQATRASITLVPQLDVMTCQSTLLRVSFNLTVTDVANVPCSTDS